MSEFATYPNNYLKSFTKGLEDSEFSILSKEIISDEFLTDITKQISLCKKNNGRLFFIGNGASAAFSNHMALDWSKNGEIPAFSLSDSALMTALGNDYEYKLIFAKFLEIYNFNKNDFLITTSSSGNSPNIIEAILYAKKLSSNVLALSGLKPDNKSLKNTIYSIYTPFKTYGMVECAHQYFHHLILDRYMNIFEWEREDYQNMDTNNFKL